MAFTVYHFLIITGITLFSFMWIPKIHSIEKKTFYIFLAIFFYLICGMTGFLYPSESYTIYYVLYCIVLAFTLYFTRNLTINLKFFKKKNFTEFINNKSDLFIKCYIFIQFCSLIYPQNKLLNLFILSHPDVQTALTSSLEHSIWDSLLMLASIFFYIGLAKYINQPKKIILLLLLCTWLSYAGNSYLSRGQILRVIVIIFLLLYFRYPQKRKILLLYASLGSVFLISFFVSYMYMRMGNGFQMINLSVALEKIVEIELSFSKDFDLVLRNTYDYGLKYIWWFFSMPLPGFLKFGTADLEINQFYNRDILGVNTWDNDFFITLPGLVIEGVYIFGNKFFLIHSIIFGLVCNLLFNIFRESKIFYILSIYYIINIPFGAIRAGTQGLYPLSNKIIPTTILIIYLWYNISIHYEKK